MKRPTKEIIEDVYFKKIALRFENKADGKTKLDTIVNNINIMGMRMIKVCPHHKERILECAKLFDEILDETLKK